MDFSRWLFWNVDTQVDFIRPEGKLYVPGAEKLLPIWDNLTKLAKKKTIRVVNTADFHYDNSSELSVTPDYVTSFPPHCMANTKGAEYISETNPENPLIIDWNRSYQITSELLNFNHHRNIVIRKDAFDVFSGNPYTDEIVKILAPGRVVVYGVTTNVCVNDAVLGLSKRVKEVYVVEDAIKELPDIPLPFHTWHRLGIKMMQSKELENIIT